MADDVDVDEILSAHDFIEYSRCRLYQVQGLETEKSGGYHFDIWCTRPLVDVLADSIKIKPYAFVTISPTAFHTVHIRREVENPEEVRQEIIEIAQHIEDRWRKPEREEIRAHVLEYRAGKGKR